MCMAIPIPLILLVHYLNLFSSLMCSMILLILLIVLHTIFEEEFHSVLFNHVATNTLFSVVVIYWGKLMKNTNKHFDE